MYRRILRAFVQGLTTLSTWSTWAQVIFLSQPPMQLGLQLCATVLHCHKIVFKDFCNLHLKNRSNTNSDNMNQNRIFGILQVIFFHLKKNNILYLVRKLRPQSFFAGYPRGISVFKKNDSKLSALVKLALFIPVFLEKSVFLFIYFSLQCNLIRASQPLFNS